MNVKKYAAPDGALFLGLMKLQRYRAAGANVEVMERFFQLKKVALPLAVVSVCLFGYFLNSQSEIFLEFQAALLLVEWMLLVCLAIWCGTFIFLSFCQKDIPLIGLLLIAIAVYFIGYDASSRATDALILLAGVTMGKGTAFLLNSGKLSPLTPALSHPMGEGEYNPARVTRRPSLVTFLVGLVMLLAFGSWWHLDVANNFYPAGVRWTGLWDNPNVYGMLMGAGLALTIGLLAQNLKSEKLKAEIEDKWTESGNQKTLTDSSPRPSPRLAMRGGNLLRFLRIFAAKGAVGDLRSLSLRIVLFVAAGMMGVGLFFSYSRGAWLGTAVGLLYLAKAHGKFKWRSLKFLLFSVFCFLFLIFGVCFFWHSTSDTGPWYLKRMDLSRASAQHRVAAWRGAVQMMRDHPFGVGWNKAVETYEKNYSPPEGGAAAITTNDYLMLGTQLGLPGLICFISYVALRLRSPKSKVQSPKSGNGASLDIGHWTLDSPQVACRAGALAMLVAFWFDGGLFTLATAAVFWVLLELSQVRNAECGVRNGRISDASTSCSFPKSENGNRQSAIDQSLFASVLTKTNATNTGDTRYG
jgi:hypothetical protein